MKRLFHISLILLPITIYLWVTHLNNHGELPPFVRDIYKFPDGDKYGHFIVMGTVSAFVLAFSRLLLPLRFIKPGTFFIFVLLITLFTIEEFSQRAIPSRTFSFYDLLASYGGLTAGTIIALLSTHKKVRDSLA